MSLTFNSLLPKEYQDLVYQMLKDFEGVRPYAYNDSHYHPTIGMGFEIAANAQAVLKGMGYSAASFGNNPVTFNNFVSALQAVGREPFPNSGPYGESAALQAKINKVANDYLGTTYGELNKTTGKINPNFGYGSNTGGSGLSADGQMQATFNLIEGTYETGLDSWLLNVQNPTAAQKSKALAQLPDSTERAALLSLTYNNLIGFKANGQLKSPHLYKAITSGNRAEAWYQIRYQSNRHGINGVARRRYAEAAMFGLYDNSGTPVTAAEAMQVYQVMTQHGIAQMRAFDDQHRTALKAAENIAYPTGTSFPKATDLTTLLSQAEAPLLNDLMSRYAGETLVSASKLAKSNHVLHTAEILSL